MEVAEYRDALRVVLDAASQATAARLALIHRAATARVDGVSIDVFLGQDGEGTFGVWARFEGIDAFGLDRQLGDDRELFGVIWGEEGWEPPVPARPSAWSREQLETSSSMSSRAGSTLLSLRARLFCAGRS